MLPTTPIKLLDLFISLITFYHTWLCVIMIIYNVPTLHCVQVVVLQRVSTKHLENKFCKTKHSESIYFL